MNSGLRGRNMFSVGFHLFPGPHLLMIYTFKTRAIQRSSSTTGKYLRVGRKPEGNRQREHKDPGAVRW